MNAIRRDEELDNLHSIYVDQWDWEKVISREDRNEDYLKDTVRAHCRRHLRHARRAELRRLSRACDAELRREVAFITTQELEDRYPDLTPKEREDAFVQGAQHRAFLMQHRRQAASPASPTTAAPPTTTTGPSTATCCSGTSVLDRALEISSMGIRVDPEALDRQLTAGRLRRPPGAALPQDAPGRTSCP